MVDGCYEIDATSVTLGKLTCFIGFGILCSETDFVQKITGAIFE